MKPACLELGGKSANIVFDDADLDVACSHGTFMAVAVLSGQGCALPTRMLVHEPVYDAVVGRVAEIAKAITVGDPFDPATVSGPVVNRAALDRIMGMIEQAKLDGARLVSGGARLEGALAAGYFIEPTVFADVDPESQLAQREVFGPVLAITPFRSESEAIEIANSTPYGLPPTSRRRTCAARTGSRTSWLAGEVLVNGAANLGVHRPFGGVGLSGFGKEGGRAGLEEFLQVKSVAIV